MTWLVMQRSVWNDIVSWRTRRLSNSTMYLLRALMTTTSKKKKTKSVGELSNTCSQIVLKCLYLARIGRPDILWSVNKLARSITKWTKAWPGRWGLQGKGLTGGGRPARVPKLRVCKHLWSMGGTLRGGRMNEHPAVVPSSRRGENLQ